MATFTAATTSPERERTGAAIDRSALSSSSVLTGLGGGVVLTAVAGAQRTSEAVPHMLAYSRPDDGDVVFGNHCPPPSVSGGPSRASRRAGNSAPGPPVSMIIDNFSFGPVVWS
jgi:hypothetical protein